jgi:hypothetical protein
MIPTKQPKLPAFSFKKLFDVHASLSDHPTGILSSQMHYHDAGCADAAILCLDGLMHIVMLATALPPDKAKDACTKLGRIEADPIRWSTLFQCPEKEDDNAPIHPWPLQSLR